MLIKQHEYVPTNAIWQEKGSTGQVRMAHLNPHRHQSALMSATVHRFPTHNYSCMLQLQPNLKLDTQIPF